MFKGGCFHRKSDDVIAGSALTMLQGVKNLVSYGLEPEQAVKCASFNPAQIMHYHNKGVIIPGKDADVIVFDKQFKLLVSIISGEIKKNVFD